MTGRTTVVTVAFNSAAVIARMLETIPEDTLVRIVDNGSSDDVAAVVRAFPNATLLHNDRNLGFGRACNVGAEAATTDYLMFLNPDACLGDGALNALENFADGQARFGAANPLIRDGAGRTRLKMSSPLTIPKMPRPNMSEPGKMPVLSGGAMFVSRAVFEQVGGFDPEIFLYHEDHDLALRIAGAGFELWHVPMAEAVHIAGTGTKPSPAMAAWKGYQMARSRFYVLEKERAGSGFARTFWPALLGLLGPTNLLSNRRRAKYVGQVKGAWSARADGGRFKAE